MKTLTHELDQISGGTAQYDAGHSVGAALRSFFHGFVEAGSMYTATL